MARIFEITSEIRTIAENAFLDLFDQLSRTCRLYYPPIMQLCNNCVIDPIGNKSSNRWLDGGPMPFDLGGICPGCGGEGYHAQETYTDIQLLINEEPKKFAYFGNVSIPDGNIECKCLVEDFPKIQKCDYMEKDTRASSYLRMKYKMVGEPIMPANIVQRRFVITLWERIN
jgi:hypothetical protein